MAYNTDVVDYLRGIYEALTGSGEDSTATVVKSQTEQWTEEGKVFEYSAYLTLASGASSYATLTSSEKDIELIHRLVSFDEEGVSVSLYRAPTVTGGTDNSSLIYNTYDVENFESTVTFLSGVTVTDEGIQTAATKYCMTGDANAAGGGFYETVITPQIIPAGNVTLLKVTNLDTTSQDVALHLVWAEIDL